MSDTPKGWDLKQLGVGGGGAVLALMLLQDRGLDMVNQKQTASNQIVIEKTIANAARIDKLEDSVSHLNRKIDQGFNNLRSDMKSDFTAVRQLIGASTAGRWTREDHKSYSEVLEKRIERIENDIEILKTK